ncbi:prolyl oligopeptidase family protein [Nonomuraea sp. NPDC050663]|uniref:prolyl oligopeptidase family protein n=1 Tax=Nonomuraea sp. NPDC050663 TaxID=3364370 RepID=UPI003797CFF7
MTYPDAERLPIVDDLHGHLVHDPYRWLEEHDSPPTRAWLDAQEALWKARAAELPWRERFRERLGELGRVGEVSPPLWRGGHCFTTRRMPYEEHPVLLRDDRVLLDPMRLDPSGVTTLDEWQPDHDGVLVAYQLSRRGDERSELYVMDAETGATVEGPIGGCRYSPVAWLPGRRAFCYVRFREGVYLHTVGDGRDTPLFGIGEGAGYGLGVSPAGDWLTVSAAPGPAAPNELWLINMATGEQRLVQKAGLAKSAAVVGLDGLVYVATDHEAPRGRLCVADLEAPERWRELVAEESDSVLRGFTILSGGRLLVSRVRHAVAEIGVHDLATGELLGQVTLPGRGAVGPLTVRPEGGHEAWFTYTDAVSPPAVWSYDARTGRAGLWAAPPGATRPSRVESRQLTCVSADGTQVRMIVVAGPSDGGPRPTLLAGYGGFGLTLLPGYAADSLAWVEAGGVLAVAGIRGGGDEGEEWHRQGMRECKQNSFDDFAAAAGKLVADGWTTPDRLVLWGESNGGLLVGAMLTQHPELFAAAVCAAPVLDMARYERSGLGAAWRREYGSAQIPEELAWLMGYSPYHRVERGVPYPPVLFTVSGGDTRVDPLHARKMCAALQWSGAREVLLRHEPDVGHGARAVSRSVELAADALAFLAHHTGLSDPSGLAGDADGVDAAAGA